MRRQRATSRTVRKKIQQLTAIRHELGWSEETCAHELGVTYSTMNRWERGRSVPRSRVVIEAIDRLLARYRQQEELHA